MINAESLVDLLLDATHPVLAIYGEGLPGHGFICTGADESAAIDNFLQYASTIAPGIDQKLELKPKINALITAGLTVFLRGINGRTTIYTRSREARAVPRDTRYLSTYFGLNPQSTVYFSQDATTNPQKMALGNYLAGKTEKGNDGRETGQRAEIYEFGGLECGPMGQITRGKVDTEALQKGINAGHAFVLRHPGASMVTFVMPDPDHHEYKFTAQEINTIKHNFNLRGNTKVVLYLGSVKPEARDVIRASEIFKFDDFVKPT